MRKFRDVINELAEDDRTSGGMVRAFRHRWGMTQSDLCDVTGLKRENLSALENDRIEMTVHYAEIFAAAFGTDLDTFLFPRGYQKSKRALEVEKKVALFLKKRQTK